MEKGYLNEGEVLQIPLANRSACSNEQEGSNSKGIRAHQRLEVKTCPVCGARCFSDMDTCYSCLHSFVHPLASRDEISLKELMDHYLISYNLTGPLGAELTNLVKDYDLTIDCLYSDEITLASFAGLDLDSTVSDKASGGFAR